MQCAKETLPSSYWKVFIHLVKLIFSSNNGMKVTGKWLRKWDSHGKVGLRTEWAGAEKGGLSHFKWWLMAAEDREVAFSGLRPCWGLAALLRFKQCRCLGWEGALLRSCFVSPSHPVLRAWVCSPLRLDRNPGRGWNDRKWERKSYLLAIAGVLGILLACMLSRFSHVWLCGLMNCNPPCSSVHGILQARILEWDAMTFSSLGIVHGKYFTSNVSSYFQKVWYSMCCYSPFTSGKSEPQGTWWFVSDQMPRHWHSWDFNTYQTLKPVLFLHLSHRGCWEDMHLSGSNHTGLTPLAR